MSKKSEPWYIHAILYVVIVALAYLLIRVAIIEPTEIVEAEKYYKTESRARMSNIKAAEILYEGKFRRYTDNLDTLVHFIKNDSNVQKLMTGIDSITGRSSNPFTNLAVGGFIADSLFTSPKSYASYILQVDTTKSVDTVINRRGKITKIDSNIVIGTKYYLECPDGYGTIGDLTDVALKNAASWE